MSAPTESYKKVHYELRPAKQVERRMLVNALLGLAVAGFSRQDYQYTGMGSIYFIDFMLFHRFLGIKNMLRVEYDLKISKRVEFNRPFACVGTKIGPIGDVIPNLSKDIAHLVWLDYDGILVNSHLQDVAAAATYLPRGSILLITVNIEPPADCDGPKEWQAYFRKEAQEFMVPGLKLADFTQTNLPQRNIELIARAIQSGMAGRVDVAFHIQGQSHDADDGRYGGGRGGAAEGGGEHGCRGGVLSRNFRYRQATAMRDHRSKAHQAREAVFGRLYAVC